MKPLCAVILNYATPQLAIDCARSVLPEIESLGGDLVIVDNASPDDSVERIQAWRETLDASAPVELIVSPKNGGFAFGNNLGVRSREAEFYVLLNSDTIVRPGALRAMLAVMRADQKLGILGPKMVGENGETQISRFRNPSPLGEFVEATGADIFYRLLRRHVVPIAADETADPQWIGFPCVMLRKETIDDIGLLDERYFMYFEDCDYCRRAAKAGWLIGQALDVEVVHFHGASSNVEADIQAKKRLPAYYYASRARYFAKWYGPVGLFAANILWHIGRALGWLRLLALKAPKRAPQRAARDIWISPDHPHPGDRA